MFVYDLYFSPASFVRYKWTKYEAANNPRAVFSLCRFRGIADESLLLVKRHQRWLVLSLVDRVFKLPYSLSINVITLYY